MRKLGLKSVIVPVRVSYACSEATFKAVIAHELRWARTVMGIDPGGHLGSIITHPLPLAFAAAVLLEFSQASLIALAAALAARIWLMTRVDAAIGRRLSPWWLIPLRDTLSLLVFAASFFVRSVEWRGVRFQVTASGNHRPVQANR